MSPAHVFEPTYEAIKRRLMTGEWATGARIEAARLADELGVSMTPVRDSLYRLNGERMVDFTPGEGFHVHRLTETEFRDLLELHLILQLAALATAPNRLATPVSADQPYPDRIADLFLAIADRSSNSEIVASIAAIGDRLQFSRQFDAAILGDVEAEYKLLEAAIVDAAPQTEMRSLLLGYHERRAREARAFARMLASHPGTGTDSDHRAIFNQHRILFLDRPLVITLRRGGTSGSPRAELFARHYERLSLTGPAADPDPGPHKRPNDGTALGDGKPAMAGCACSCRPGPRLVSCSTQSAWRRASPAVGVVGLPCLSDRPARVRSGGSAERLPTRRCVSRPWCRAARLPAAQSGRRRCARSHAGSLRAGGGQPATRQSGQSGRFPAPDRPESAQGPYKA